MLSSTAAYEHAVYLYKSIVTQNAPERELPVENSSVDHDEESGSQVEWLPSKKAGRHQSKTDIINLPHNRLGQAVAQRGRSLRSPKIRDPVPYPNAPSAMPSNQLCFAENERGDQETRTSKAEKSHRHRVHNGQVSRFFQLRLRVWSREDQRRSDQGSKTRQQFQSMPMTIQEKRQPEKWCQSSDWMFSSLKIISSRPLCSFPILSNRASCQDRLVWNGQHSRQQSLPIGCSTSPE